MSETVNVNLGGTSHQYKIRVGNDLLRNCGAWVRSILPDSVRRVAVVTNPKVYSFYGDLVLDSLRSHGFNTSVWKMGDGEKYKTLNSFKKALAFFSESGLTRSDAVIALGGGVVGDLTGFAASAYLRGIHFLQIPTTLLSMIDSSVGGKTGVNTTFGKNLIGSFYQPMGVLIDVKTLGSLARRELTAGFCEAIKQGAIANKLLFQQTREFLLSYSPKNFKTHFANEDFLEDLQRLVAAQVRFKAEIVVDDEHEAPGRNDARSRKILNFGHTVAHALEKITNYKYLKHGEAVGYGILVAAEISKNVANLEQNELNLLNDVVASAGDLPDCGDLDAQMIVDAFSFDKKNVGNALQWILLKKIGEPIIFPASKISNLIIIESIKKILMR